MRFFDVIKTLCVCGCVFGSMCDDVRGMDARVNKKLLNLNNELLASQKLTIRELDSVVDRLVSCVNAIQLKKTNVSDKILLRSFELLICKHFDSLSQYSLSQESLRRNFLLCLPAFSRCMVANRVILENKTNHLIETVKTEDDVVNLFKNHADIFDDITIKILQHQIISLEYSGYQYPLDEYKRSHW